jgi:hypothetical protein
VHLTLSNKSDIKQPYNLGFDLNHSTQYFVCSKAKFNGEDFLLQWQDGSDSPETVYGHLGACLPTHFLSCVMGSLTTKGRVAEESSPTSLLPTVLGTSMRIVSLSVPNPKFSIKHVLAVLE